MIAAPAHLDFRQLTIANGTLARRMPALAEGQTIEEARDAFCLVLAKDLDIPTLESRNNCFLDSHEVAVWDLKRVLQVAFEAGRASAQNG